MSDARIDPAWPNPVRSPSFQAFYSNLSRILMTPWDISLSLGSINAPTSGGQASVHELAIVTFSPQQFKALSIGFVNAVAAYEAQFGAINVNPNLIPAPDVLRRALEAQAAAIQAADGPPGA